MAADHTDSGSALPVTGQKDNPPIPSSEIARYKAMLLDHLRSDGPEQKAILLRRDRAALQHWAHRSAGAFLVVDAQGLVRLRRQAESLCHQASDPSSRTPEIPAAGSALRDAVHAYCNDTAGQDA